MHPTYLPSEFIEVVKLLFVQQLPFPAWRQLSDSHLIEEPTSVFDFGGVYAYLLCYDCVLELVDFLIERGST